MVSSSPMRSLSAAALLACSLLLGCSPADPVKPPAVHTPVPGVSAAAPPAPAPSAAPVTAPPAEAKKEPRSCGELGCLLFDTPEEAFAAILAENPSVIAIGESHAQKGVEAVPSSTRRFTEHFLPLVKDKATDLVLEIWVADPKCNREQVKQVAKEQKQVTQKQADTNQNEFVALGDKSFAMGIKPHVLRPSCDEYDKIIKAGPDAVVTMLEMITRLTLEKTKALLAKNDAAGAGAKMVLTYGGALHNDLSPKPGRETWSFGPALSEHTKGRYVELDIIVPEYIQDNDSWRTLPWHSHFDRNANPGKTTVFRPAKGSWVLIFPKT